MQLDKAPCEKEQQSWTLSHLAVSKKIEKCQRHLKFSLKAGGHQQIVILVVTLSLGFTSLLLLKVNTYLPDYYYLGT